MLEQAHREEVAGGTAAAAKHYRMGDNVIREALQLEVPSVGLGPAYSNTARWRADLAAWLPLVAARFLTATLPHLPCMQRINKNRIRTNFQLSCSTQGILMH